MGGKSLVQKRSLVQERSLVQKWKFGVCTCNLEERLDTNYFLRLGKNLILLKLCL